MRVAAPALLLTAFAALPAAPARADDAAPAGSFVLRGVRVERGDGTVIEDAVIVVRDGRIETLGPAAEAKAPPALPVVEGAGGTVTPAFVLPVTRLGLRPPQGAAERPTPTESVLEELDPFAPALRHAARAGIGWVGLVPGAGAPGGATAAVRPPAAGTGGFVAAGAGGGLRVDVDASTGWSRGLAGVLEQGKKEIEAEDRYEKDMETFRAAQAEHDARKAAHEAAVKEAADRTAKEKAEAEKAGKPAPAPVPAPAPPADLKPPQEPKAVKSEPRTAAVRDALRRRIPVVLFCGSAQEADRALDLLRPWRVRLHVWASGDAWRVAARIAGADASVTVRAELVTEPASETRVNPAAVFAAEGCAVSFAPLDEGRHGLAALRLLVGRLVRDGLPRAAAVRGLCADGAAALGLGDRAGLLEPGRAADLLLFDGDPLEPATALRTAWYDGVPR